MPRTPSELRIFISSTFQDLRDEREYLVKRVFPEIRTLCRSRGVEFTEIDLRWGLTEEEATHGKIIRTCLEEIDRCRPYFIGIVGDRYGWAPKYHEVQKDAELIRGYPWIEDMSANGISIMEMEFEYAVLQDPAPAIGSYFYFRKRTALSDSQDSDVTKLDALRKRTRASKRPVKEFSTAAELGEFVRNDLVRLIEVHWHSETSMSLVEIERNSQEAFASTRRRAYILNPEYLKIFNDFIEAPSQNAPLVITGVSGIGKSSLISYLAYTYERHNRNAFMVAHYIGASNSTSDHSGLLRHICLEIKERLGIEDEVPTTTEELTAEFSNWLAKIQEEKLIILIDAVNQLDGLSLNLKWLPAFFPQNLRLIISTTEGDTLDVLNKLSPTIIKLTPIDSEQREAIIVRFLGEYHKSLNQIQSQKIARNEKCAVPLFLRTLLEEIRLAPSFSKLDEQIDYYLQSEDMSDLFRRVLIRMETDYGAKLVQEFMTLIHASRFGLSETELLDLLSQPKEEPDDQPFTRLDLSLMLNALDYHLIRKDGLLNFFHSYLRIAVEERYLGSIEKKLAVHIRLGKYFATQPITERRVEEEPWQWEKSNDKKMTLQTVTDPEFLFQYFLHHQSYELLRYWKYLKHHFEFDNKYYKVFTDNLAKLPDRKSSYILRELTRFYLLAGYYVEAKRNLEQLIPIEAGNNSEFLSDLYSDYATVLYYLKDYNGAELSIKKAIALKEEDREPALRLIGKLRSDLGAIIIAQARYEEAEQLFRVLIQESKLHGQLNTEQAATDYNNLGEILREQQRFNEAIDCYLKALLIIQHIYGDYHHTTADILKNLGKSLRRISKLQEAEEALTRSIEIYTKILGEYHIKTLSAKNDLGVLLTKQGKYEEAIGILNTVYEARKNNINLKPNELIITAANLSVPHLILGNQNEAKELLDYIFTFQQLFPPSFLQRFLQNNLSLLQKTNTDSAQLLNRYTVHK